MGCKNKPMDSRSAAVCEMLQIECEGLPARSVEQLGIWLVPGEPLPHNSCSCVHSAAWQLQTPAPKPRLCMMGGCPEKDCNSIFT